jgi:hypothetical protein
MSFVFLIRRAAVALLLGGLATRGGADVLVCDFTGTAPGTHTPWTSHTLLAPGLAFSGWTRGAGAFGQGAIHNAFGFYINAPGSSESSLADALAENEYIGFTLTPTTGSLNLRRREVAFTIRRVSWHAPRRYVLFTSVGGFSIGAQVFSTGRFGSSDLNPRDFRFFLPEVGYDGLTSPVEFRLYATEANYNHSTSLVAFSITDYPGAVFSLSVGSGPGGSARAEPDAALLRGGETVRLHADPDPGYRFTGWVGDLTGLGNPAVFTLERDMVVTATFAPRPAPRMEIGMNPGGISDWGSDWPFVDLMKKSRRWLTRNADGSGSWDSNLSAFIPRDADGYPLEVPFDPPGAPPPQIVHTLVACPPTTGTYIFACEGTGRLRLTWPGGGWHSFQPTGGASQYPLAINQPNVTVFLEILETSAGDHLRRLRLVPPGFPVDGSESPFQSIYMDLLRPFTVMRFMDWGVTNASPLTSWAERTTTGSPTQASRYGVALEYMADLANELGRDAWVCIPHAADDDYVRRCARLLRDRLGPARRLYVEYSNETWNTAGPFPQTTYVMDRGEELGLAPDRWTAGQRFVALRSVQIWRIFEEEFGPAPRLVRVMGTQAGWFSVTELRTAALNDPAINPDRVMPDALAIAPYFGENYFPADITANGYPSVDEIVTTLSLERIESARAMTRQHRELADRQGWRLICYEGGQHFVGLGGAENDTTLTAILIAANRDPRMYDRYLEYLDMLRDEGVDLFGNFSFIAEPSKWGSWGVLERQDQPLSEAHKYRALIDWMAAQTSATVADWRRF